MNTINSEDLKNKEEKNEDVNYVKKINGTNNETFFIIMWCLMFLSLFTGFTTSIVAAVMAHIKRGSINNTEFEEDQLRYAVRTFWFSLLWLFFIPPFGIIWLIYRSVKGFLYFSERNFLYLDKR